VKPVIAEGNYVVLHVHSIRLTSTRGRSIIEIFGLENGKIDEHRDMVLEIPETSNSPNGIF
jgi:predicted SnoaL-like aldol condensation-catalyzing enzyme